MKNQAYNPYLPSYEYIPDGEPRVFGDRLYLYGSHDRFNGAEYCLNDYVCWSAPAADLTDWRYEGVIYKKVQDPRNQNIPPDAKHRPLRAGIVPADESCLNPPGMHAMWAPDVVRGLDGKYYLYYCLDYLPQIAVAVCDTPAGAYEYLGLVRHADGTALGEKPGDLTQFDPGVFIDDDETVYLYSGNSPMRKSADAPKVHPWGSQVMTLETDMLTLRSKPRALIPNIYQCEGTSFADHAFFEASSVRKIGDVYYFIYSSVHSHELCYATSAKPDGGYVFGGTLVDIGDIFLNGRGAQDAVNALGNTHGSIEFAHGQWYVFYHRQTNRTEYSRQACAEKITLLPDGSIPQAEVTSCGLHPGPLAGHGEYPARICCHLTGLRGNVYSNPPSMKLEYPYFTQDVPDMEPPQEDDPPVQHVANMRAGYTMGFKYFLFHGCRSIAVKARGRASGKLMVSATLGGKPWGEIPIALNTDQWTAQSAPASIPDGVHALYLTYDGTGSLDVLTVTLD